jgi:hypothetical protein
MLDSINVKDFFLKNFWPFETMVIMAHYSFLTHMNVKKLKLKILFDPILGFGLIKDF